MKVSVNVNPKKVNNAVLQAVQKAVVRDGLVIETFAKVNAPVDTGRLRSSISADFFDNNTRAVVDANTNYAANVEFGIGQKAQPFMRPALNSIRKSFLTDIGKAIRKAI